MQITSVSVGALLASLFIAAASAAPPDPVTTEPWAREPVKVTPGEGTKPPSDAIVLFDGSDLREWQRAGCQHL